MSSRVRAIAVSLLAAAALSSPAAAQSVNEVGQFKALMAQAAQQYSHAQFHLKWMTYKPSGDLKQRARLDGFMAGAYCVTEQTMEYPQYENNGTRSWVSGSNSRYRFSLNHKADAYVLTEVSAPPYVGYQPQQCSFALPYTPDTYHGLLGRADTRVVGRSEVAWRGRPAVEWVLDTTIGAWKTSQRLPGRVGLLARPDRPGLVCGVRQYDGDNPKEWLTETVVEYEADEGPWPTPKALEEWQADKSDWLKDKSSAYKSWRWARREFGLWRRLPVGPPGAEFTLSHYKLPEPTRVPASQDDMSGSPRDYTQRVPEPPPGFDWRWLALAGALAALVAAVAVWWRRRRSGSADS